MNAFKIVIVLFTDMVPFCRYWREQQRSHLVVGTVSVAKLLVHGIRMMHKSCSPSDFYTELQATDLLSYADVPGAIDLHRTYRGVTYIFTSDIYFHFEVKKKFRFVNTFISSIHKTMKLLL